jgi:hypothetical protein
LDKATPFAVWATGAGLLILSILFLWKFLIPGAIHWRRLSRIRKALAGQPLKNQLTLFEKAFSEDPKLLHIWHEYVESLFKEKGEKDGQMQVVAFHATAPAEMYFHPESVYESRLHAEFFKHLPGIFTGIGIIGTFSGLISGLSTFDVSENALTVRMSLQSLMHSVGEAFYISAAAIGFAMLATFVEKFILAGLSKETGEIVRMIDESFEAGVGEKLLARLVDASVESASQAKIVKDALVQELSQILRELTEAQIAATREQAESARQDNQALGATIAESIRQSLEAPMQEIASTVKTASGDQSASAVRMLQDVMSGFSEKLNSLFGEQISGINSLNQEAALSMQDANKRSTDAMAEQMAGTIAKMEARQEAMNAQSAAFIEQIRELVATSQSETSLKLQSTLENLGNGMEEMLGKFNASQLQTLEANREREQALAERTSHAVGSMADSVESVVAELSASTTRMVESVASLTRSTSTSVEQMQIGAAQLGKASQDFAAAGGQVSGVMERAAAVTTKLSETSGALSTGGTAIQQLLRDYQTQRGAVESVVVELRATVEAARKEATITADVLNRIEGSAQRLGVAQRQADEYLDGVSRVLGDAHTSFASEVKRTLDRANTEFHGKLTSAVGMLSATVQELEATLQTMGTLVPQKG